MYLYLCIYVCVFRSQWMYYCYSFNYALYRFFWIRYLHTHLHLSTPIYTYLHTSTHIPTHTHTSTHLSTPIYTYLHLSTHLLAIDHVIKIWCVNGDKRYGHCLRILSSTGFDVYDTLYATPLSITAGT